MTIPSGQIFLSHPSEDKGFVERVYARLDVSSAFYDKAAKESRNGSRLSIAILECAIAIEYGVSELLPETVELALAAGRQYDAWQLQARQAVRQRNWAEALELLSRIERKDYFDFQLESRALQIKKDDSDIARDPVAIKEINDRLSEILIATYKTPEGYRNA